MQRQHPNEPPRPKGSHTGGSDPGTLSSAQTHAPSQTPPYAAAARRPPAAQPSWSEPRPLRHRAVRLAALQAALPDWPPPLPRALPIRERRERQRLAAGCCGLVDCSLPPLWGAALRRVPVAARPPVPSLPSFLPSRSCRRSPCTAVRSGSPRSAPPPRGTCAARQVLPQPCPSHRPSPPSQVREGPYG